MKRLLILTAVISLAAVAGMAQSNADFSGTWVLDKSRSKLDDRSRIESMTLTVTQTASDITVAPATKRLPPPADAPQGRMGRGGGMGGDNTFTYLLNGKETAAEVAGPMGNMPVKLKAGIDGGKLSLSNVLSFSGPMGEFTATNREAWSLSEDGKTLTVVREMESPRGTTSTTLVFTKQ